MRQQGSGPNAERQEAPHPHAVVFDPAGRYIATADLGIDKVEIFELQDGKLAKVSEVAMEPGAGPRHVAFNPDGTLLYVISELNATIAALPYDADSGKLGAPIAAVVDGAGRFPGSEEHGRDPGPSLRQVPLRLEPPLRGTPRCRQHRGVPARRAGRAGAGAARDRAHRLPARPPVRPDRTWLYALNQKGDSIVQFTIDQETGELTPTGNIAEVPTPVSLVFTTGG